MRQKRPSISIRLFCILICNILCIANVNAITITQIAKFMGLTWDPSGSCRPQMGPMLAPWALLSGKFWQPSRHSWQFNISAGSRTVHVVYCQVSVSLWCGRCASRRLCSVNLLLSGKFRIYCEHLHDIEIWKNDRVNNMINFGSVLQLGCYSIHWRAFMDWL